jgi:hypothetical protein
MKETLALKAGGKKRTFDLDYPTHFCVRFAKSRDVKTFQKPRSHLKLLGAGEVI